MTSTTTTTTTTAEGASETPEQGLLLPVTVWVHGPAKPSNESYSKIVSDLLGRLNANENHEPYIVCQQLIGGEFQKTNQEGTKAITQVGAYRYARVTPNLMPRDVLLNPEIVINVPLPESEEQQQPQTNIKELD